MTSSPLDNHSRKASGVLPEVILSDEQKMQLKTDRLVNELTLAIERVIALAIKEADKVSQKVIATMQGFGVNDKALFDDLIMKTRKDAVDKALASAGYRLNSDNTVSKIK